MDTPTTLEEARDMAERKALADCYGFSDPFSALAWLKTLPIEWQPEVNEVIRDTYHTT